MNLKHLTDTTLLNDTKKLSREEREITTQILHHLKEIERRKLFSDLGYPSMLAYAVKELNYSESSASKRIQAARLLADIPEIESKINSGKLTLTNIHKASSYFRKEQVQDKTEKKQILKQVENLSSRDCEKTLFSFHPEPVLPKEEIKVVSESFQQLKVNISDETLKSLHEARALLNCWTLNDECLGAAGQKSCVV